MLPEPQVAVQLGLGLRNLRDPAHPTTPAVRACVRVCVQGSEARVVDPGSGEQGCGSWEWWACPVY